MEDLSWFEELPEDDSVVLEQFFRFGEDLRVYDLLRSGLILKPGAFIPFKVNQIGFGAKFWAWWNFG